jgi:L-amino acid N-acyltransferase YncA
MRRPPCRPAGGPRRGTGAALFAATRDEARRQGRRAINAAIRADNTGGLAFYGRMGFEDYQIARGVPLKDGTPVDRVRRRYRL